jgi:hypothetical protein
MAFGGVVDKRRHEILEVAGFCLIQTIGRKLSSPNPIDGLRGRRRRANAEMSFTLAHEGCDWRLYNTRRAKYVTRGHPRKRRK